MVERLLKKAGMMEMENRNDGKKRMLQVTGCGLRNKITKKNIGGWKKKNVTCCGLTSSRGKRCCNTLKDRG